MPGEIAQLWRGRRPPDMAPTTACRAAIVLEFRAGCEQESTDGSKAASVGGISALMRR